MNFDNFTTGPSQPTQTLNQIGQQSTTSSNQPQQISLLDEFDPFSIFQSNAAQQPTVPIQNQQQSNSQHQFVLNDSDFLFLEQQFSTQKKIELIPKNNNEKITIYLVFEGQSHPISFENSSSPEKMQTSVKSACQSIADSSQFQIFQEDLQKNILISDLIYLQNNQKFILKRVEDNNITTNQGQQSSEEINRKITIQVNSKMHIEYTKSLESISKGTILYKLSQKGKLNPRLFLLLPDQNKLIWLSKAKAPQHSQIYFKEIKAIQSGQKSANFLKYPNPLLSHLSFSIIYGQEDKELDLVCLKERDYDEWQCAVKGSVSAVHSTKISKQVLLSHCRLFNDSIKKGNISKSSQCFQDPTIYDHDHPHKDLDECFLQSKKLDPQYLLMQFIELHQELNDITQKIQTIRPQINGQDSNYSSFTNNNNKENIPKNLNIQQNQTQGGAKREEQLQSLSEYINFCKQLLNNYQSEVIREIETAQLLFEQTDEKKIKEMNEKFEDILGIYSNSQVTMQEKIEKKYTSITEFYKFINSEIFGIKQKLQILKNLCSKIINLQKMQNKNTLSQNEDQTLDFPDISNIFTGLSENFNNILNEVTNIQIFNNSDNKGQSQVQPTQINPIQQFQFHQQQEEFSFIDQLSDTFKNITSSLDTQYKEATEEFSQQIQKLQNIFDIGDDD